MSVQRVYDQFHYNIAPPIFVVVFTLATQIFAFYGTTREDVTWSVVGNKFSWMVVLLMFFWGFCSLWVPGKDFKGPTTSFGYTPVYKANGFQYYFVTVSLYLLMLWFWPQIGDEITRYFPQILATCNICALLLCIYLILKGKYFPESTKDGATGKSIMYEFYSGVELHPRILGVDVKQLTNCRFGLMSWGLLVVSFFVSGYINHGYNRAFFVCAVLQILYLGKFYWWETDYFSTLDITLDRAGYYICWGCIVWVPCLYTFSSYYLSSRVSFVETNGASVIFIFGSASTVFNYWVDWQKSYFREQGGKCFIWGRLATFIPAPYQPAIGGTKKALLLTSGFWGAARHMNYLFEIMVAISWSLPSLGHGIWPFIYPIFLSFLLTHRIFRDEKKCQEKYGAAWDKYCESVPYRMIPGLF